MIRGTTPTHTFTLPFDTSVVQSVRIIYAQDDKVILTKETAKCTLLDNTVMTTLTQEDTLVFDCDKLAQIQIRVLTTDGDALVSQIERVTVDKCLDGEVLT